MMRKSLFFLCLLLLVVVVACQDDLTSSEDAPTILFMSPNQVFPGQENVQGQIRGTNYKGIVAVDLGGDIRILETNIVNPTELSVRFSVKADATAGPKTVRVTTLKGTAVLEGGFTIDTNRAPVASFTASPTKTGKGTPVQFDASASNDPDGSISKYEWNFGDGSNATGVRTEHTYNSHGNFTATLKVTDNKGGQSSATRALVIENVRAPIAVFDVDPNNGDTSTVFRFDADRSRDDGRIVEYQWDFGDGRHDKGKVTRHQYDTSREFNVKLKVTDNDGLSGEVFKEVGIRGKGPQAEFTTIGNTEPGSIIEFDASASSDQDGRIVDFDWDMGDSTKLNGKKVTHKYTNNGAYNVKLTVTDDSNLTDSASHRLDIQKIPTGGQLCSNPVTKRSPDLYGVVVAQNQSARTVTVKLYNAATCADVFYQCGDLKHGGDIIYGGPEKWIGVICKVYALGNNTFRVHIGGGKYWPSTGLRNVYLHWQRCGSTNYCAGVP
ncbi:PKD domain-containing protein [bacterium]|nr:PKD domain-containing protein [bacterium]MCI0602421.1 PKD domain-containing protein [bacterium]